MLRPYFQTSSFGYGACVSWIVCAALILTGCSSRPQDDETLKRDSDFAAYNDACVREAYGDVLEHARKLVKHYPKNGISWNCLGFGLEHTGDKEGAFKAYQRAVRVSPKLSKAWYNLGLAWRGRHDLEKEIQCYQKAVEVDPSNARAWFNLSSALAESGALPSACSTYRRAIRLDPALTVPGLFQPIQIGEEDEEEAVEGIAGYAGWASFAPPVALDRARELVRFLLWNDEALVGGKLLKEARARGDLVELGMTRKGIEVPAMQAARLKDARELNNLALRFENAHDWKLARQTYNKALLRQPSEAMIWNNLGIACAGDDDYPAAIEAFESAQRLAPGNPVASRNLGVAHAAQAGELLKRGSELDALREMDRALERNPDADPVRFAMASLLRRRGRWDEALEQYQWLIRQLPTSGNAWQGVAACAMKTGQMEKGLEALSLALQFSPNAHVLKYWYAMELLMRGKEREAFPLLESYVKAVPFHGGGWYALGVVRVRLGKGKEGIEALQRAVSLMKGEEFPLQTLAAALMKARQPEQAAEVYHQILELDPERVASLQSEAGAWGEAGRWDRAWPLYERLTQKAPNDPMSWARLAGALIGYGNWSYGLNAGQKAIDLGWKSGELWSLMGVAFAQVGQKKSADAAFQKAMELSPKNPAVLYNAACFAKREGRSGEFETIAGQLRGIDARMAGELSRVTK